MLHVNGKKTEFIIILLQADFDEQLTKAGNLLVVVDFYATWCGPCKVIAPKLEEFANTYQGKLVVLKVDVDENEELTTRFSIQSMPTFLFLKNGEVVDSFAGANETKLQKFIDQYL